MKRLSGTISYRATDLYTVDPDIIKNYIGEGPKTLGMPDAAPG